MKWWKTTLPSGRASTDATGKACQADRQSQAGDVSWQAHAYNMLGQTARLQGEFRRANSLLS